jgi:hypothetical protein
MDGIQKTIYERLLEIAMKVKDGAYGKDDEVDVTSLDNDLADAICDV